MLRKRPTYIQKTTSTGMEGRWWDGRKGWEWVYLGVVIHPSTRHYPRTPISFPLMRKYKIVINNNERDINCILINTNIKITPLITTSILNNPQQHPRQSKNLKKTTTLPKIKLLLQIILSSTFSAVFPSYYFSPPLISTSSQSYPFVNCCNFRLWEGYA